MSQSIKTYHSTSKENWKKIQKENILWGIRNAPSRCTYLAFNMEDVSDKYGDVLLEVEFDPSKHIPNNYDPEAWQVRVYCPIDLSFVKIIK